jgi:hypothetical protein
MDGPGKGAWIWHCHVIAHAMGPDGKSINIALANGGMVIPVVYEDSENIAEITAALTAAIASLKESGIRPGSGDLSDAVHDMNSSMAGMAVPTPAQ